MDKYVRHLLAAAVLVNALSSLDTLIRPYIISCTWEGASVVEKLVVMNAFAPQQTKKMYNGFAQIVLHTPPSPNTNRYTFLNRVREDFSHTYVDLLNIHLSGTGITCELKPNF